MTATFELPAATLTDALFDSVQTRIINGLIEPGERVTEARLATEYAVARPTAKACIDRLVQFGLLRKAPHKAGYVPLLDHDSIADLFFSRNAIERAAVAKLAADGMVGEELQSAQRALARAARDGEFAEQVAADLAFHSALVAATGSERLGRMHRLILGEVALTMGLYSAHKATPSDAVAAEHDAVLSAIRDGDVSAAERAIERHLYAAAERVLARIDGAHGATSEVSPGVPTPLTPLPLTRETG